MAKKDEPKGVDVDIAAKALDEHIRITEDGPIGDGPDRRRPRRARGPGHDAPCSPL